MKTPAPLCPCQTAVDVDSDQALSVLGLLRSKCPVLGKIVVPPGVWPAFEKWHAEPDDVAFHRSVVLLALQRGCLSRLTAPLHEYLMDEDSIRQDVSLQYLSDLQERWMMYADPLERHRKSRVFRSRTVELQYAHWLASNGTIITGLEAHGASSDIQGQQAPGTATSFEVKFIGVEDTEFAMLMKSFAGLPAGGFVSLNTPINYLLFRVYEAAKQLAGADSRRVATAIIDDSTWWRFEPQLSSGWIDWAHPHFLGAEPAWEAFLDSQKGRYPEISTDLPSIIDSLDEILILRHSSSFEFFVELKVMPARDVRGV